MPIIVQCTGCGGKFRAPDEAAGKRVKCPKCSAVIDVRAPAQPGLSKVANEGRRTMSLPQSRTAPPRSNPPSLSVSAPVETTSASPGSDSANPHSLDSGTSTTGKGDVRPSVVNPLAILRYTCVVFRQNWVRGLGVFALIGVVVYPVMLALLFSDALFLRAIHVGFQSSLVAGLVLIVLEACFTVLEVVLGTRLMVGPSICFLKMSRGERFAWGEVFSGSEHLFALSCGEFVRTVMLGLTSVLAYVFLGLFGWIALPAVVFLALVAVVVTLVYWQFYYLVLDCNMRVVEAFVTSGRSIVRNLPRLLFVFGGAVLLVPLAASLAVSAILMPVGLLVGLVAFRFDMGAILGTGLAFAAVSPVFVLLCVPLFLWFTAPALYLATTGKQTA